MTRWPNLIRFRRRISRDTLIQVARSHAEASGWPWQEPVIVNYGLFKVHVMTNANHKGGNVNVWLSARDGDVVSSGFARR
jgi:hypothetical protein